PQQGQVLDLSGGGYVDAKDIGDNNLAVLRDLTIAVSARVDTLDDGQNTLVAFGGAHGSANGSLNNQESANHAYELSMTADGNLQFAWQHDDAEWETITSTAPVGDPTQWHDYEIHRDGDNKGVAFFVDGMQLGQTALFGDSPTGGGSGSLYIGSGVGGADRFDGFIDNVSISSAPVTVVTPILGDINGDGEIAGNGMGPFESDDVTAFVEFWLQVGTPADLNFDGVTNIADWGILNSLDPSMGAAALGVLSGENTVPEPSAVLLLVLASFGSLICRRQNAPHDTKHCSTRSLTSL
ncbi:MAG: LamG-like jellyroll fold domain-containing protein, partial [Bythopirellula sp.]